MISVKAESVCDGRFVDRFFKIQDLYTGEVIKTFNDHRKLVDFLKRMRNGGVFMGCYVVVNEFGQVLPAILHVGAT